MSDVHDVAVGRQRLRGRGDGAHRCGDQQHHDVDEVFTYPPPRFGTYADDEVETDARKSSSGSWAAPGLSAAARFGAALREPSADGAADGSLGNTLNASPAAADHSASMRASGVTLQFEASDGGQQHGQQQTGADGSSVRSWCSAANMAAMGPAASDDDDQQLGNLRAWVDQFHQRMQCKTTSATIMHQRRFDNYAHELDRREMERKAVLERELAERAVAEAARRAELEAEARAQAEAALARERDAECAGMTPEERIAYERDRAEMEELEAKMARHAHRLDRYADFAEQEYGKYVASEAAKAAAAAAVAAEEDARRHLGRSAQLLELRMTGDAETLERAVHEMSVELALLPLLSWHAAGQRDARDRARARVAAAQPDAERRRLQRLLEDADEAEADGEPALADEIRERWAAIVDDHVEADALRCRSRGIMRKNSAS